jgi:hypothetical protein
MFVPPSGGGIRITRANTKGHIVNHLMRGALTRCSFSGRPLCKFGQRASSFARNDTEENAKAKFKNADQRPAVQKATELGDESWGLGWQWRYAGGTLRTAMTVLEERCMMRTSLSVCLANSRNC